MFDTRLLNAKASHPLGEIQPKPKFHKLSGTLAQSQPFVPGADKEARGEQLSQTLDAAGPVKGGPDQVGTALVEYFSNERCKAV